MAITCSIKEKFDTSYISCKKNDKEIGHARIDFYKESTSYPRIGIFVPSSTAVYGPTEVDKPYRGKGLGTKMLMLAEQKSIEKGMKRMIVPAVQNPHFFVKNGYFYTGKQRIFEKNLINDTITPIQKRRTDEYLSWNKKIKV